MVEDGTSGWPSVATVSYRPLQFLSVFENGSWQARCKCKCRCMQQELRMDLPLFYFFIFYFDSEKSSQLLISDNAHLVLTVCAPPYFSSVFLLVCIYFITYTCTPYSILLFSRCPISVGPPPSSSLIIFFPSLCFSRILILPPSHPPPQD